MSLPAASDLLLPLGMAAAAGLIGSIAVMRRMTLASDAISHVALPGITAAMLIGANPVAGGFVALVLGALLVWSVEQKTRVPTEAIIGVVFSAALAIGSMLASGEELIEALFGAARRPSPAEAAVGLLAAAAVIVFAVRARSRLVITLVSPDLARTIGINVARTNLVFLLAFALTVALGLRYLGVLLMGSLIIIPAATGKLLARSLSGMRRVSVGSAMGSMLAGSLAAPALGVERGPLVIAASAAFFFASLLRRQET
ncbi:MAG TPA: metal ABC transporter permease [Thermoanaerobaculia bacterium]